MHGRYRTAALQTVGVVVLAALIFVAFLRPSEPEDLAGIDAPGNDGGPATATTPGKGKHGGDRNRRRAITRATGNAGHGGSPLGVAGDDGIAGTSEGDDGPDDDQYTDLVSLLMDEVGQPGLYREIDEP